MHGQGHGGGWGNGQPPGGAAYPPGAPAQPGHPPHAQQPHPGHAPHPGPQPHPGHAPHPGQQSYPGQQPHPGQQQPYPGQPGAAPHGQVPHPGQQPYAGPPAQLTSGLFVTAEYSFLQWMLMMTNPVITVYGRPMPFKWGRPQVVPLPPGNHPINIHFPWVFQKGNSTDAVVPVHPGHATDIRFSTAFFVFSAGTIAQRGFRPWGT